MEYLDWCCFPPILQSICFCLDETHLLAQALQYIVPDSFLLLVAVFLAALLEVLHRLEV